MKGFVLTYRGKILPESFRFTREAVQGITATWIGDGRYQQFQYWHRQGYKIRGAWLELTE